MSTTFQQTETAATGPDAGLYVWSDPANWTNGVPVDGDAVTLSVSGLDDIAALTLASLTIDPAATLDVAGSLTLDAVSGPDGTIEALGTNAVIDDLSPSDPGELYAAGAGGTLVLAAAPAPASGFLFAGGTIALMSPAANNPQSLSALQGGDVLELPGTSVVSVSFGTTDLTVVTNAGTYAFGNVTYAGSVDTYSATVDPATGLEAITFAGPTAFQQGETAATGPYAGDYLWSDPANWNNGLPAGDGVVSAPASGQDDIATLTLAALTIDPTGVVDVAGTLVVQSLSLSSTPENDAFLAAIGADANITIDAATGAGGVIEASGANALVDDLAPSDPGELYDVFSGAKLLLTAAPSPATNFLFVGGTIALAAPAASNPQHLYDLLAGDVLELPGTSVASVNFGTASLTITTSAGSYAFTNVADADELHHYTASHDAGTGLEAITFACYAAGTRILTAHGPVAVEYLAVGDTVPTRFGGPARIEWLGYRHVDCRHHPRPEDVWPVRVRAHAIDPGIPGRDVLLSPDHALLIDDGLIPVRHLVNGRTIAQEPRDHVTYWHVELAHHDVIFAEGLAAESYLDTGNRGAFANGGKSVQLHPDFSLEIWRTRACRPLVRGGAELEAARSWLLHRAEALGHSSTNDPALHVLTATGRAIWPEHLAGLHRFRLPSVAGSLRLVSRAAIPAQTHAAGTDIRRLGVAISGLHLDGVALALDDPRLSSGWHAIESDAAGARWRWTDGDAGLALAGTRVLDVAVVMTECYALPPGDDGERSKRSA